MSMVHVVPAILEKTFEEVQQRVKEITPYSTFVQLDVMDGVFVPNVTFQNPEEAATLQVTMELHLMIEKPEFFISRWALPNVTRMIVHYEAVSNVSNIITQIRGLGKEVAIAINPGTSTYVLKDYLDQLDMVLVMGVEPGFSGQDFHYDVLEKIKEIKKQRPEVLVEVDGGVNKRTRNPIVTAGTDILAAASYLWKSEDVGAAMEFLKTGKTVV